jgi:hypothetical protein
VQSSAKFLEPNSMQHSIDLAGPIAARPFNKSINLIIYQYGNNKDKKD